jgi:hypothetical protein
MARIFHMHQFALDGADFSNTQPFLHTAWTFPLHEISFTWREFFTRTSVPSDSACFSLAPDFLYMARTLHVHQLFCFTWRRLFTCTNFALDVADFSHALLLVSFRFHIQKISFRRPCFFSRFQIFLEMALPWSFLALTNTTSLLKMALTMHN